MRLFRALLVAAVVVGAACEAPNDTVAPWIDAQFAQVDKIDPACKAKKLKADQKGKISKNDCLYDLAGRDQREDLYVVESAGGSQMMTFTASADFDGLFGITEDGKPLFEGIVLGSRTFQASTPNKFHFIGGSPTYGVFFSGWDETQFGKYTLTTEVGPVSYQCGGGVFFIEGDVEFDQYMDGANSCAYTIEFPADNPYFGNTIWTHGYNAKVVAGEDYTVRIEGLSAAFMPALSIFTYGPFSLFHQDLNDAGPDGAKEITFTAPYNGYLYFELSSGRETPSGWQLQTGTYTFLFSPN